VDALHIRRNDIPVLSRSNFWYMTLAWLVVLCLLVCLHRIYVEFQILRSSKQLPFNAKKKNAW